jgi:heat shock protein HtpX
MNQIKTTLLLTMLTVLLVAMGGAIGGKSGMIIAFLIAGGMNFFAYWNSDKIVLRMYNAREVTRADSPDFYGIVEDLARKADMPMPKVYVIPSDTPNAFATGRNPQHAAVAATTGIMRILSRDELEGVMAHEMTHVMNRAISMLGNMLQWAAIFGMGRSDDDEGGGIFGALAMAIIAPIAAMLIQMAVSRSREFMADAGGAKLSGKPKALASALMKLQQAATRIPMQEATPATSHMFIVNPLTANKLANLFSTHPSTEERVARLMAM